MKTIFSSLILSALLSAWGQAASVETVFQPGEFVFMLEDEKGYLMANQALLNEVLAEISLVSNVPIFIDPAEESVLTADLREKTLEQIIDAIVPNAIITFARGAKPGEYNVSEVRTMSSGDPVAASSAARQRVIEENNLDERLSGRLRRPVSFVGIGANISVSDDRKGLWLSPISEDSPAYKGGIRKGDMATEIDGRRIEEFRHLGEAIMAIRGQPDTSVKFRIRHPDGTESYKTITRELFRYDPRSERR
jgi:membrane-associated protease RseP (regulator of RpoE activity)